MSTTPSIQSSTRPPALAPISVAPDPGLADTRLNNDSEMARTHSPSLEIQNGESSPLTPLNEGEGEHPSVKNAAPLEISQEEYAAKPDKEVERNDDDPSYIPGGREPDADRSGLLHYDHRRPLGVSTSAVSKSDVKRLDPNGGQCLFTRDLATETGVENAHLLPQAWSSKPQLLTSCEWALGQRYKSLHVDEPRNIVKIRKDWHWNYDQKMFILMPALKTIDAFEARRVAFEAAPSDYPPDIMSLYGEEDIFEYRLVPLTKQITNIFRFNRDDDPVPPTTPSAPHNSSNSDLIPPTTSDDDHTASQSDPPPPAASEADHHAADSDVSEFLFNSPDPQPHLSTQKDNFIADGDSNPQRLYVDASTQTDIGLPAQEIEVSATQDGTSKMDLPAAESNWSCHRYPFNTLPVLRSHALPHFVLLNAGDKLENRVAQDLSPMVARIFKVSEYRASHSLIKLQNVYNSWVHAVIPSTFYSTPQLPSSTNKTTKSGGEQEQAEPNNAMSETIGASAADMNDHPGPRPEHNDGQIDSDRSQRYSRRQKEEKAPDSHSPADAVTDTEVPPTASVAHAEGSYAPSEPSRSSTAVSLPALGMNAAAPSVAPATPSVAPATPSVAPATPSVAPAAPPVAPAAPSVALAAHAEATSLAKPAPVEPIEVPLYSQVAAARMSVASGKAPNATPGQARHGPPTKIPTAIQTHAQNTADVGGSFLQGLTRSGKPAAGSSILIQNKTTVQESSAWKTVRYSSPPAGSKNKDSRHASGYPGHDSVPAKSRTLGAGEMDSHDTTWTRARRSQTVSASHAKGTGHDSGHLGKGKLSPGANFPRTGASATLDVPIRVEEDLQSQRITRRLPAPSLGLASASQDTRTNDHSSTHRSSKSGGDGALDPPEQKRRRVARPSEGEANLSTSRIPRPVGTKIIDQMKPKPTPSLSHRRISFAQDQGEDHPVASGSQGMTERMPAHVMHPSSQKDSGSTHTDNNEQDEKGRKSSKSGKKRRHSRRSLGETF